MAMSRSFGGTSLTRPPSTRISPSLTSSRPAIMRSVVDFPQPDGPTRTTNSWSAMSRLIPHTASVSSKRFTTLRSETSAIVLPLGGARSKPGDVIIHEERIKDERRGGAEQHARHDLSPVENIALDQGGNDSDRQNELVGRRRESKWIKKLRPRDGEREDRCRDQARQGHRDEHAHEDLSIIGPVHQRGLVELLGDRREIADHDPGAERHGQCRIENQQDPPAID